VFVEKFRSIGQRFVFLYPTDRSLDLGEGSEGRKRRRRRRKREGHDFESYDFF
jgi:hypothetical protein